MARRPGAELVYRAADLFRDNCLSGKASLLWPTERPWTLDNLQALWTAFVEHPDVSDANFFVKLKDQLEPVSDDVCRVAADILAFYYLFPQRTSAEKKLQHIRDIVAWKSLDAGLDLSSANAAFEEGGISYAGTYYNTGIPWLFAFLIRFGIEALQTAGDLHDVAALDRVTSAAAKQVPKNTNVIRNATLYLLSPDFFERIASDTHKRRILEVFADLDPGTGTLDARLYTVREKLALRLGRPGFDFYEAGVEEMWRPEAVVDGGDGPMPPQVWVEKTIVQGRPDRVDGDHALGKALWSPQRARGGADIYKLMRDVRPGDVVLHLTDNEAFTGISRVASPADSNFTGVANTDWADQPGYRIQLEAFRKLEPPLSRSVFFSPPFGERLVKLARDGVPNLFYNSEPALNQGKYLTIAPPDLVEILNDAYQSIAHRDLIEGGPEKPAGGDGAPKPLGGATSTLSAVCTAFSTALQSCGVTFGARHEEVTRSFVVSLATKRFVILTGLSGSGKTQLGLRFGEWLGGDRSLVVPVRPDWTGAEALFGFEDALQPLVEGRKAWQVPEALQFILRAARDGVNPHLLLLDEMNLAHVERYFADVLSGMESGQPCLPNLVADPDGNWRLKRGAPGKIAFPNNLFIVGTVNVDETTYMFSPKVLDRANTFEFRVATDDLISGARRPKKCGAADAVQIATFAQIASDANWHVTRAAPDEPTFRRHFTRIHELLVPLGFEYGHRTFVEAIRFASLMAAAGEVDPMKALDLQIMQKILPRLHGSRRRLEPVLSKLGAFCADPNAPVQNVDGSVSGVFDPVEPRAQAPLLPISLDKIRRMTVLLRANQFVSFTE